MTQPSPRPKLDRRWRWIVVGLIALEVPLLLLSFRETANQNELLKEEEAISVQIKAGHESQEALWSQKIYNSSVGQTLGLQIEILQGRRYGIWQQINTHAKLGSAYLRWGLFLQFMSLGIIWFSIIQSRRQKTLAPS